MGLRSITEDVLTLKNMVTYHGISRFREMVAVAIVEVYNPKVDVNSTEFDVYSGFCEVLLDHRNNSVHHA
jgi:hypothetical protein